MGTLTDLDRQFKETEGELQQGAKRAKDLQDSIDRQQADDRSVIAKMIIWAFVVFVGIVVVAAILGAAFRDWNQMVEPAKFLMGILGSIMLPVVTLVIGYYFGKK